MLSGVPLLAAIGACIVIPSAITVALLAYGAILYKLTKLLGGDPSDGWFPIVTFLSFSFWVCLLGMSASHHH